jgi:hypothetical protein
MMNRNVMAGLLIGLAACTPEPTGELVVLLTDCELPEFVTESNYCATGLKVSDDDGVVWDISAKEIDKVTCIGPLTGVAAEGVGMEYGDDEGLIVNVEAEDLVDGVEYTAKASIDDVEEPAAFTQTFTYSCPK